LRAAYFERDDAADLAGKGVETVFKRDPWKFGYGDAEFDLVTAVCVYHHVPPASRAALTGEVRRVLRPGGIFCMIEHNPVNPVTRLIVSRTPVDSDAILLPTKEARSLAAGAGLAPVEQSYFLYFPPALYRYLGRLETMLAKIPLGGQYALFSRKPAA
jgi:SAM-dependent methyltransferase